MTLVLFVQFSFPTLSSSTSLPLHNITALSRTQLKESHILQSTTSITCDQPDCPNSSVCCANASDLIYNLSSKQQHNYIPLSTAVTAFFF
ncbi:hypothetical protein V8C26DRAFT_395354 [Trichoderma gracile]